MTDLIFCIKDVHLDLDPEEIEKFLGIIGSRKTLHNSKIFHAAWCRAPSRNHQANNKAERWTGYYNRLIFFLLKEVMLYKTLN